MTLEQNIQSTLEQYFADMHMPDMYVVEITTTKSGQKITAYLDSDDNLSIERCAAISRFLEKYLEENKLVGEKYTLDVSSPGVGKPLKLVRQYAKNIGRIVAVNTTDERHFEQELKEVTPNSIVLTIEEKVKIEGTKKKELRTTVTEIPFESIKSIAVKLQY